ncbi:MAG: hypothetical protein IJZ67_00995 [Alistipes sp.]|nr:hypothetical protein [Alistipes sp.]
MKKLIFMAVALLMATACMDLENKNNSWSRTISGDMVTTNTESGVAYTDNASVTVEVKDITKPYINLLIEGVKFVPMMPDVNFLVSDIQFKLYPSNDTNDPLYGSWIFNEKSVVPTVGGVPREEYTMLNLIGSISDNGVVVDFDVNFGGVVYHATFGRNDALQTWEAEYNATADVVINPGAEGAMTSTDQTLVSFAQGNLSKQVVNITFKDFRFVAMMPEITFTLTDVPFSYSEDGTQRLFNVASIVPTIGDQKFEQYTMTNFTGSVTNNAVMLNCDIASMNARVTLTGMINK